MIVLNKKQKQLMRTNLSQLAFHSLVSRLPRSGTQICIGGKSLVSIVSRLHSSQAGQELGSPRLHNFNVCVPKWGTKLGIP